MENFEQNSQVPKNRGQGQSGYSTPGHAGPPAESPANYQQEKENVRPVYRPAPASSPYRGAGTGRKESPYANSPYVTNRPPANAAGQTSPEYRVPSGSNPPPQPPRPRIPDPEPESHDEKKSSGTGMRILAVVAAVLLVFASCGITGLLVNNHWEGRMQLMEQEVERKLEALEQQLIPQEPVYTGNGNSVSGNAPAAEGYSAGQIYAQNVNSVVLVETTIVSSVYGQTTTGMSAGSGFVLSEDGYVVTNYHVIQGGSSVKVVLYDGTRLNASVVGYDSTNDIAVLKAEAFGLNPVTLGSSTDLIVGDQVIAIGNPLGELTSTLTAGYVSAKERNVSTDGTVINMIQTDAAINSGNSGGPLFNMKGEVVGITTAKYSGSSSSGASIEGIGFAIPIDDVLEEIDDIIQYGYVKSAYMGVEVQSMDPSVAEIYGLPVGAYVAKVVEGGAAHRAGIQPKDIITRVGDTVIESLADLTRALREYEPGEVAQVEIFRSGKVFTLQVTLDERPQDVDTAAPEPETNGQMPEGSYEDWFNFFAPFFGYGD